MGLVAVGGLGMEWVGLDEVVVEVQVGLEVVGLSKTCTTIDLPFTRGM